MGSLRKKQETPIMQQSLLTPFQKFLLYGSLLGDAYLYPKRTIQFEQSHVHKESLFWLFHELKSLTTGKQPSLVTRFDTRTQRESYSYLFYTRSGYKSLICKSGDIFFMMKPRKKNYQKILNRI